MAKAKRRITNEQLGSLTYPGKVQEKYWREFLPKMYNELADEGKLYEILKFNGDMLSEMMEEQIDKGLDPAGAMELVLDDIYSFKPEKTKEDEEEAADNWDPNEAY